MTSFDLDPHLISQLAEQVGTPFWIYDGRVLRQRREIVRRIVEAANVQARYAMKACPATRVLREMQQAGIWIDAVSGNEALRAIAAGYTGGQNPPRVLFTTDVFRDNALEVLLQHRLLPNIGSPGMIQELANAGYSGPISLRVNPGFGHGHVNTCDTGGPSSKHGVWLSRARAAMEQATKAGMPPAMLHAHIGSGPKIEELETNLTRLAHDLSTLARETSSIEAISLGGGIPHNYRNRTEPPPIDRLIHLFEKCADIARSTAGRPLRIEIEPGRFFVAPAGSLVARVKDIKETETNEKGSGATFVMVDAGFNDLVRPAMYGAYHAIEINGKRDHPAERKYAVAGPLCESGDVFTRDENEMLVPRDLPKVDLGDLLLLRDAGAYGYSMSSNYNSIGRAPQIYLEEDGQTTMISRRETIDDILKAESGC